MRYLLALAMLTACTDDPKPEPDPFHDIVTCNNGMSDDKCEAACGGSWSSMLEDVECTGVDGNQHGRTFVFMNVRGACAPEDLIPPPDVDEVLWVFVECR